MWTLHIAPAVMTYIYKLRQGSQGISEGIRAIATEAEPWVDDRAVTHRPNRYERFVAGHWITYYVNKQEKIIRILAVEPNV